MPNIFDNEDLYNSIVLGGVTSPGQVTLSGHDRKVTWDVKAGPSLNGASMTLKAIPPIEFTATFYLIRDAYTNTDDFAAWPAFRKVIDSTVVGTSPKALDVYHPDLADNDIKSVVKSSVGAPKYDGKGGATIEVKFQEYRAPKKTGGSPLASPPKPQDPNADLQAQIAKLTAQYQNTPWG